jgi:hypothetical protein
MPPRHRITLAEHIEPLIRRIAVRRQKHGDRHLEECPDHPAGVVAYLRKRPMGTRIRWDEDVDALALIEAQRDQLDDFEEAILGRNITDSRGRGPTLVRLGAPLGIKTARGVIDRWDRLRARHQGDGRRDEKVMRAERAAAREGERETPSREDRERAWIAANADHLIEDRSELLSHRALWESDPDAVTWLDEIESDHRRGVLSPAAVNALWSTLIILRESPALSRVGENHPVRLTLSAAAELRRHARRRLPPDRTA